MTETCSTFDLPPERRRPRDVAAWLLCTFGLAVTLAAGAQCTPPGLPPVTGCSARAQACVEGEPAVCSTSGRWHRSGDVSCREVRGVCVERGGVAFCAPASDAGVTDAADAAGSDR